VPSEKRGVGMVFQNYALFPSMNVRENIAFGLSIQKTPKAEQRRRVDEVADRTGLALSQLEKNVSELSGGQQQRVAIARALALTPSILLLDEPLSNLDAKLRMETRTELKRLHQMLKTTVVYVTHDQIEAMTLATRIAVMRDGRIEQLGTPEEIYNRPATLYVAGFVGAPPMNMLEVTVGHGRLQIAGSSASLPMPARFRNLATDGRKLILGVRPETMRLGGEGLSLEARADVAELTGPELVVTALVGTQRIMASLPPRTGVREGTPLILSFDEDVAHLFDPETGRALA
jgi:multiple sugar transport system ATP-binding protein